MVVRWPLSWLLQQSRAFTQWSGIFRPLNLIIGTLLFLGLSFPPLNRGWVQPRLVWLRLALRESHPHPPNHKYSPSEGVQKFDSASPRGDRSEQFRSICLDMIKLQKNITPIDIPQSQDVQTILRSSTSCRIVLPKSPDFQNLQRVAWSWVRHVLNVTGESRRWFPFPPWAQARL
jgi:hypothetical protein